ncbi:NAD-dependent epimerase [Prochlorococcus sp. MIT 1341]|uniref:NAD-dependent epimerase n=1 Tax=Prochlorococcus sp. MIT 1341 TaxID=3096221 RepID=UPI002A75BE32|nr:NAD-dependent epimerase [Prochlorococcus sp. MIT 1341]
MSVLVTGAAGFIGFHLAKKLLEIGTPVLGIDNLNPYYDPTLKKARLDQLDLTASSSQTDLQIIQGDIENNSVLREAFEVHKPKIVVNLAAQAGVRYSIENPNAYIQSNLVGFANVLECCRHHKVQNLIYASSSSVYGGNTNMPFSEKQGVDHPVSLYAATKKANELMAHTYSHLYGLPATGLRFFTVYGPWGRPDMALFLFTNAMLKGEPIKVFNEGNMIRDFTFIDDIIESVIRLIEKPAIPDKSFDPISPDPSSSWAPHRIFNIGNSKPTPLMEYINALEEALGIKAKKTYLPIQPGDVPATSSDTRALQEWIGFKPNTSVKEGVDRFVAWYRDFYDI